MASCLGFYFSGSRSNFLNINVAVEQSNSTGNTSFTNQNDGRLVSADCVIAFKDDTDRWISVSNVALNAESNKIARTVFSVCLSESLLPLSNLDRIADLKLTICPTYQVEGLNGRSSTVSRSAFVETRMTLDKLANHTLQLSFLLNKGDINELKLISKPLDSSLRILRE